MKTVKGRERRRTVFFLERGFSTEMRVCGLRMDGGRVVGIYIFEMKTA